MAADALIDGRAQLQRNLLAWFGIARRDLPWRRRRSLYGTWISEIMLQQTTVAAVVPYWERFLARFPDVGALAAADEQDVLGLWSGLGYYRRARHLHAAARRLQGEAAGRLPTDRVGWAALPGVGAYAAGAIASIGLGERCAALDANARRVITRWAAGDEHELGRLTPARLRDLAESLVPAERPGDWNEAVMELGAIVCRARDPQCASCPVAAQCRAGRAGSADRIPLPARRAAPTAVALSVCVVRRRGALLMLPPGAAPCVAADGWGRPVRDDFGALHRGLWGLPGTPWYAAPADPATFAAHMATVWSVWAAGRQLAPPRLAGTVAHGITRFRLAIVVCALDVGPAVAASALGGAGARWVTTVGNTPTSKMVRKVVAREKHTEG